MRSARRSSPLPWRAMLHPSGQEPRGRNRLMLGRSGRPGRDGAPRPGRSGGKDTMRSLRSVWSVRIVLAAVVLAIGVGIYVASLPSSDAIAGPHLCTYYSSATKKKAVGGRGVGCCGETISWGTTSLYFTCQQLLCPDVLCPN